MLGNRSPPCQVSCVLAGISRATEGCCAAGARDLSETPGYWQRTIRRPTAGEPIAYPDPTDLLLHLILHAALDHRFNNGPLTLSDIGYLLQSEPIDWTAFWQRASEQHCVRACWLTLRLVEQYWGALAINWPDPCPSDREGAQALETAAALMLRDYSTSGDLGLAHASTSGGSKWGARAASTAATCPLFICCFRVSYQARWSAAQPLLAAAK